MAAVATAKIHSSDGINSGGAGKGMFSANLPQLTIMTKDLDTDSWRNLYDFAVAATRCYERTYVKALSNSCNNNTTMHLLSAMWSKSVNERKYKLRRIYKHIRGLRSIQGPTVLTHSNQADRI